MNLYRCAPSLHRAPQQDAGAGFGIHHFSRAGWTLMVLAGLVSSFWALRRPQEKVSAASTAFLSTYGASFRVKSPSLPVNSNVSADKVIPIYKNIPLSFEANNGQTDPHVKFLARGAGYALFFTEREAMLAANGDGAILRMQLAGAGPRATINGMEELPGKTNYFHGNDPRRWQTNVANYAKVRYHDVYPGVDLVFYGHQGQLEYDFVVAPGADPRAITLSFAGARRIKRDRKTGDLVLKVRKHEVRFHPPVVYQQAANADEKHFIAAHYALTADHRVTFHLARYDHSRALVIDPTLSYSTYLGGTSNDYGNGIAVDTAGNAYVVGYTASLTFPVTSGAFQTSCGGGCSGGTSDAFITKLDPTGTTLVYSTYLGGSANDYGNGIGVDAAGNAFIVGQTYSSDFPVTSGAFQVTCTGSCSNGEAFVTELNSTGSGLVYSTYLGGSGLDQGNGIALDASDNAYVVGTTQSTDFPVTPGVFQSSCSCSTHSDLFITKLNSTGSGLIYSTYLGGGKDDVGYAIALSSGGNAYVTGYTRSTNFPTTAGAFQTTLAAQTAAFVSQLNSTASALVYSTYLGGKTSATTPCEACGASIAVDSSGNAYVCGLTAESNFPVTPGAFQTKFMSSSKGHDAFITKLNLTGTALVFSTYLGGTGDDGATGIAVDSSNNIWVKGNTKSSDFPITVGAFQTVLAGSFDAWVAELSPSGSALLYSTYLGGTGTEFSGATRDLALDNQNPPNVFITGYTDSTNFPIVTGAFQSTSGGLNDAFVSRFAPSPNVSLSASSLNFGDQAVGTTSSPQTVTLTNTGNTNLDVTSVTVTGTNQADFNQSNTCTTIAPQATCTITATFTPSIVGNESATITITDNAPNTSQTISVSGVGVGQGPAVTLSPTSLTFPTTLVHTSSAPQTVTLTNTGTQTLQITAVTGGGDFSQTNTCGSSVPAGANCTITVKFTPSKTNTDTGTITITDNASNSPQTIPLTGTGTFVQLSSTSLNFGDVKVGTQSTPQTVTLTNTSIQTMTVSSISVTGADPRDFSETNTCGSSVASKASCTITVTFKPTVTGSRTGNVSISDSGGASPQLITLSGTGT